MPADVISERLTDPGEYKSAYNILMSEPSNRLRIDAVVETLRDLPARIERVLDIGSGAGAYVEPARRATRMLNNARFCAMDWQRACVAGYRLNHPDAAGVLGDATRIPFAGMSFDLAMCLDIVEHIDDDLGFLRDVGRVLRPGGHLVLSTHNAWSLQHPIGYAISAVQGKQWLGWDPTHVRFYSPATLRDLLRRAGFEVVRFNGTYYLPFHLPARLFSWPLERIGARRLAKGVHQIVQAPAYGLNWVFEKFSYMRPICYLGWGIVVVARRV